MKKIGIITFHRAYNFGAMLQAFALQKTLDNNSCCCKIIDYRCNKIESDYYRKNSIKIIIKKLIKSFFRKRDMELEPFKRKNYARFEKSYLVVTEKKFNSRNIYKANLDFDIFVCGSDQVWNLGITDNDWNYYLSFTNKKKISYAGSFGNVCFNRDNFAIAKKHLSGFDYLFLREKSSLTILESMNIPSNINQVVCDPVFLLNKEQWENYFELNKDGTKEKYILVYLVARQTNSLAFAKYLSDKYNLPIKYIHTSNNVSFCPDGMENCNLVGPDEFLHLLYNSTYFITTSFHGCALSLILNKVFFYELDQGADNRNSRIVDLIDYFGVNYLEIKPDNFDTLGQINVDFSIINDSIFNFSSFSKEKLNFAIFKDKQ